MKNANAIQSWLVGLIKSSINEKYSSLEEVWFELRNKGEMSGNLSFRTWKIFLT